MKNSFHARQTLKVNEISYEIFNVHALPGVERLPFSLKILLENLLRHEDGVNVRKEDIDLFATRVPGQPIAREIAFTPARVLMQDFTGVPAVVDLAAMREAMAYLGGDPKRINPLQAAELVIDHSVQVDAFGSKDAFKINTDLEFERNHERYAFLKWGQAAFTNFKVVPPDTGIVHQVNLEYLARVVFTHEVSGKIQAYPDTVVGTDSHTTMINGLGVLGWGVGGIEAEAALLGQAVSMLIPQVVGVRLHGQLSEGTTATDLVLTIVERLRKHGVVGKFVEFYGPGLDHLSLADRATIANMAPEYGATCGIFPIDADTIRYLQLTGRTKQQIDLVAGYARAQGLYRDPTAPVPSFDEHLEMDLGEIEACIAGPKRPQDRVPLKAALSAFNEAYQQMTQQPFSRRHETQTTIRGQAHTLKDGAVVIAAITSCTNTSNPSVMLGAGLLARKAVARGLKVKAWVKTSLAPGSRVVTEYLEHSGLLSDLAQLGFHNVGYGCTTCIGNSGPLLAEISQAIHQAKLTVSAVLSGNRNFEGRVHPEVRMNYLASPPLVVAYALAGRMDIDWKTDALGTDTHGQPVFLRDLWPSQHEIELAVRSHVTPQQFTEAYEKVFRGDAHWNSLVVQPATLYPWDPNSTYVRLPPYFAGIQKIPEPVTDWKRARVLAWLGDSVTTDHISPAGSIKTDSPAGAYLQSKGVAVKDFNSYGSRRGNHEVMVRGTFANIRLRNKLSPGTEGGVTCHQPSGDPLSIYDASVRYQQEKIPSLILAGKEYGSGSSRDWAAKGPRLLGVVAVIAESYERIHRTNLVCMGILPLQYIEGQNAESLKLNGQESYDLIGLDSGNAKTVTVRATPAQGKPIEFSARVRIDTPQESEYYRHGGILPYVLRQLASS